MSRLIKMLTFVMLLISLSAPPAHAQAQTTGGVDPRIKALGLMAVYGAVGGFLLGTASLAFDTPGRSPFIGASLGLYAGMLFGGFIVVSHAMKKYQMQNPGAGEDGYYPETPTSPYETPFSGGTYEGEENSEYSRQNLMNGHLEIYKSSLDIKSNIRFPNNKDREHPAVYMPLLNISF
jgi:hypothetical protein